MKTWTLSEIRQEFRDRTGRPSTTQISDSAINDLINEYYVNDFPTVSGLDDFKGDFSQLLLPTDSGIYSLSADILRLLNPMTIDGQRIKAYYDKQNFFDDYPQDNQQYITSPTLSIGTSNPAYVKNAAFGYKANNGRYSKASAETALSGSSVPQNKYGAWCLKIDENGTITCYEADNNAIGYSSASQAIDGLPAEDGNTCFMGYVTAINTAGEFIAGATELSAAGVTATYTDGLVSGRGVPESVLISQNKLYFEPKPNDVYAFACPSIEKPTALSGDTDVLADARWGEAIALGTSIKYLMVNGQTQKAQELKVIFDYKLSLVLAKKTEQLMSSEIERNW